MSNVLEDSSVALKLEIAEINLLEAISKQRIYGFKNKREIVFDSHVGMLFANLHYIPLISYNDWKAQQKNFAPDGIAKGQWRCLHNFYYQSRDGFRYGYKGDNWLKTQPPNIPKQFYPRQTSFLIIQSVLIFKLSHTWKIDNLKFGSSFEDCDGDILSGTNIHYVYPAYHILKNKEIFPNYSRKTDLEKAKIILDFFFEQEWVPEFETAAEFLADNRSYKFEDDEKRREYIQRLDLYYAILFKRHQLEKQQLAEFPECAQTLLSVNFDYRPVLAQYPLAEIAQSFWQYSRSAQRWLNTLLKQLDEWEIEHYDVITPTQFTNFLFTKALERSSQQLNEQECGVLNEHHQYLTQKLNNFLLTPTRQKLIALLEQNQQLEQKLEQTDDLQSLAELEQYSRPSFPLLAEHSATLCTKKLASLEWLKREQNLTFVQDVVFSAIEQRMQYLTFVDKYQQDLQKEASDNSIEDEHIQKWLTEWRTERLTLLQQWLPLVKAGFQYELEQDTVCSTLVCLRNYQEQIDQFYLKSRLGIFAKYAFTANGHRQEQLEKDSELIKLNHQFMQALQTVIFSLSSSREKLWLLNYSEVWQKHIVQEIQVFLQNENLLERDDIAQLMMDDMRKIQQQSLASCLQDAERYSEALEQRNKSVNTLIFKMRKALSTEK